MPEPSRAQLSHPGSPGFSPHFHVFGIPVHVASSFWLIAILLGIGGGADNPGKLLRSAVVSTVVVFASVLLHELGHALSARAFGARPAITLYMMGGLTRYEGARMSRLQSGLISLAGPTVGLVTGALVWGLAHSWMPADSRSAELLEFISFALWVNIGWSIINLLPVVPFDGGHILSAILGPRNAYLTASISALVGAAAAAAGFFLVQPPNLWVAFIFGSAAVGSVRQARYAFQARADERAGLHDELSKIRMAIAEGRPQDAETHASNVVRLARTPIVKNGGLLGLAWAEASLGRTSNAREKLDRIERGVPVDSFLLAAVEEALGSPSRARAILEAARSQGVKSTETTKLLIDLCAREGDLEGAARLAIEDADALGKTDGRAVLSAAMSGSAHGPAAELAARLFQLYGDPVDAVEEARALALSGHHARAIDVLEELARVAPRSQVVAAETLRNDPAFRNLLGDARFERLLSA